MVMASRTFKIYIQWLTIEWLIKKGGGDPCLSWACECRHHRPQSLLQWVPQGAASFDHLFSSFIFAKSQFWRKKITVLWSQYHNPTIPADCHEEKRTTERRQSSCCVQVCIKHYVIQCSLSKIDNGILHCCLWDFCFIWKQNSFNFLIMTSSMIKCRTFDVNDTGRISESKFRQILATKQVPKDDVEGILQGVEMKSKT